MHKTWEPYVVEARDRLHWDQWPLTLKTRSRSKVKVTPKFQKMTVFVPAFLLGIALKHDMHKYWHFNGFQHNWYQFWTLTFPWMTMTRAQTACYCSSWTERHRRMKSFVDAISAKHSFGERPLSRIQRPSNQGSVRENQWRPSPESTLLRIAVTETQDQLEWDPWPWMTLTKGQGQRSRSQFSFHKICEKLTLKGDQGQRSRSYFKEQVPTSNMTLTSTMDVKNTDSQIHPPPLLPSLLISK